MKKTVILLAIAAQPWLTGCHTVLENLPGVYTIDIEQGNMIDQTMIDQLRPNMTKRQVLYIMGSPMLTDSFHEQRWDYLYSFEPSGREREQKRISLYFDGDRLAGVQGDLRPSAQPTMKPSTETTIEVPKRQLKKTMWGKISSVFTSDESNNPQTKQADTTSNATREQNQRP